MTVSSEKTPILQLNTIQNVYVEINSDHRKVNFSTAHLPKELIQLIFKHLSLRELTMLGSVCKKWSTITKGNNLVLFVANQDPMFRTYLHEQLNEQSPAFIINIEMVNNYRNIQSAPDRERWERQISKRKYFQVMIFDVSLIALSTIGLYAGHNWTFKIAYTANDYPNRTLFYDTGMAMTMLFNSWRVITQLCSYKCIAEIAFNEQEKAPNDCREIICSKEYCLNVNRFYDYFLIGSAISLLASESFYPQHTPEVKRLSYSTGSIILFRGVLGQRRVGNLIYKIGSICTKVFWGIKSCFRKP